MMRKRLFSWLDMRSGLFDCSFNVAVTKLIHSMAMLWNWRLSHPAC